MPPITPRQNQILELLLKHRKSHSINKISEELGISRTAVLQHFATLEKKGYITESESQKTRGRPARHFALTERGIKCFPKQYAWFSELLLKDFKKILGTNAFRNHLKNMGMEMAQQLKDPLNESNITDRLKKLINIMTDLGYQANLINKSENNSHTMIEAHNCVYHELAQSHPEICEFDIGLMSTFLEQEVKLTECLAKGGCACRFKINTMKKD
ncbi:MAG: HTH domain-containing protein [Methylococcales bacterium]|jgi:predicted ArsR family transcriptional regulator|nr:HTH domain-containing protein [Methylococcales bacterium]